MGRFSVLRRRAVLIPGMLMLAAIVVISGQALAGTNHTGVVSNAPSTKSPWVLDGHVDAMFDTGSKIIAGGTFTQAQDRNADTPVTRSYLLSFDKVTGDLDPAFAPVVSDEVYSVVAGPTAGTVLIAGKFNQVNGVNRRKLAVVNISDGSLTTWKAPAFDGLVNDVEVVGNRLYVAGIFATVGGVPHAGLASLDFTTAALDPFMNVQLTGHHNWFNGCNCASAGVGADRIDVSPDGTKLIAIGNFKNADGVQHDQVVQIDLTGASAAVANWNTTRYESRCASWVFDSWVRDLSFSPDGSYFVIVTTGAPFAGTLCDSAARWETDATGSGQQPTWVDYSGGDTFLSVDITEVAVYVGGHMRWMNNSLGSDRARAGAVGRPSIAALDPLNGLPFAWNPGRHPRGYGITELYATPDGLWIGHDTDFLGNFAYKRPRIAFIPLTGGYTPHSTAVATLPGNVYQAGNVTGQPLQDIFVRTYDGASAAGALTAVANPDATNWNNARGAFWVGGTLFYGANGTLNRRTFDGATFGTPSTVDPYHDAYWDTVLTGSGPADQTYAGVNTNFYSEINSVTGMFYWNGRLYYTLDGNNGLYYRWFTPDSGIVGADKFTVSGATGFSTAGGIFVSGDNLYVVNKNNGSLSTRSFVNGVVGATSTVVSGPPVDSQDWRGRAVFVGP